jgi:hypothetical protein
MAVTPWKELSSGAPRLDMARRNTDLGKDPAWAANPQRRIIVDGLELELYPIGAVAKALGRSSRTIRRWETRGLIPPPLYERRSRNPHGRRRLYTRQEIEGLIVIAEWHGVLAGKVHNFASNDFARDAHALYAGRYAGRRNSTSARAPRDALVGAPFDRR